MFLFAAFREMTVVVMQLAMVVAIPLLPICIALYSQVIRHQPSFVFCGWLLSQWFGCWMADGSRGFDCV
jgi:hypothetical protein